MNFLEARRIVANFSGGEPLPFVLAMSGTPDALDLFLKATAAVRGRSAQPRTIPFNTLAQWSYTPATPGREVVLLFPWDLVPALDWRSGVTSPPPDAGEARDSAAAMISRLRERPGTRLAYVAAPVPPLFPDSRHDADLVAWLGSLAQASGARVLPPTTFALGSYLGNGSPFAGAELGAVAETMIELASTTLSGGGKVLITDLDNVMWNGVIGEDGVNGIACSPEGAGYRFFLYQTMLAKLQREGVLLAAVSRNDEDLAHAPFRAGKTVLREEDFVAIVASYNAKSAQIASLADRLNLGVDSFTFVDDNPIELAEVGAQLPALHTIQFPARDQDLPAFLSDLARRFGRSVVSEEDRQRTELYRRRMEGMAPSAVRGADLTEFLRGLGMTLVIHDRTSGDRARAVQLINKTNQFNLNGRRVTDEEVGAVLASGGRLLGASLEDRSGSHGEILSCLIARDGTVESLVMSCRVFQRRVEHAFFGWLASRPHAPTRLRFAPTERNEPIRMFLEDPAFASEDGGLIAFDAGRFAEAHGDSLGLFELRVSEADGAQQIR